ncbi:MAG: hypothetical protein ACTSU5_00980, partial [Promethearchaeota archaeon]
MGFGKSNMIRFLAKVLGEIYQEEFHAVQTDTLQIALENITQHPYQLIIIDDAISKGHDARRGMSAL